MTLDLIELDEQSEKSVYLTKVEVHELRKLKLDVIPDDDYGYPEETNEHKTNDAKQYRVNPKSLVGHFRLSSDSSRIVTIKPKVGIRNVFALLGASYNRYRKDSPFKELPVGYDVDVAEAIEPLVEMFNEEVRKILQDGLLKRYVEIEENRSNVKGRIIFSEQIRRNLIHPERIFCRFSQSEVDIPENQVILFTLLLLRRNGELSASICRELTAHILHFGDVSICQFLPKQMPLFTYDRLSQRYKDVHSWCRLFIDMMSLSDKPGNRIFNGFLLDMNVLFERFVISMFEKASRNVFGVSINAHHKRHLTISAKPLMIEPDLLLIKDDVEIPVDAKYKITKGPDKAKHPDLYQIIAYCSALGLIGKKDFSPHGILVYPQSELTSEDDLTANLNIITKKDKQSELRIDVHGLKLASEKVVKETEEQFSNILQGLLK
jgi:5-methylcytosine-specific restriction endonuclease McrBC regulatory subunit McrC